MHRMLTFSTSMATFHEPCSDASTTAVVFVSCMFVVNTYMNTLVLKTIYTIQSGFIVMRIVFKLRLHAI